MVETFFSTSVSWTLVFGGFLMMTQLGQNTHQRDVLDHATSVAADTVTKTLCADAKDYGGVPLGTYAGARAQAVTSAVDPLLSLVAPKNACKVNVKPTAAGTADPGSRPMDVEIACEIPCKVPFAAQVMCSGWPGHVNFTAKQTAMAMGCDG
jgi:hypothetical protein